MGTLLHSCAKVCETIKLPFEVVSGVGPGIGVLDESTSHKGKGISLNGLFKCIGNRKMYSTCVKI